MSSTHPYYRRRGPSSFHIIRNHSDSSHVDLRYVHLPTYGPGYTVDEAVKRFDARTAEFIRAGAGLISDIAVYIPSDQPSVKDLGTKRSPSLLDDKGVAKSVLSNLEPPLYATPLCLAALAYVEYFPYDHAADDLRSLVSSAVVKAIAGWCGSLGRPPDTAALASAAADVGTVSVFGLPTITAGVPAAISALSSGEGNYDLDQMPLLLLAYRYYDDLTSDAREYLIRVLLAKGKINRPGIDEGRVSSGRAPQDWGLVGEIELFPHVYRIGETENHILQIHTTRYLTNQLLYQRDRSADHDNRRNGPDETPELTCMNFMLHLLRNFLVDDFSEYNAKPYQTETRNALRNLCSYAYDHEVRLAARMVLDYISAHVAVSSCDLRRMVPFRRRNEAKYVALLEGFLDVGLIEWRSGADRSIEPYVVQTGNTRAYESRSAEIAPFPGAFRATEWSIQGSGNDAMMEGLGDYRIPPLIHDLFVNDLHRTFIQYVHRTNTNDERTGQNADNWEIYAGSPSYLITAGGAPAGPALDVGPSAIIKPEKRYQQLGVAVTTSFMPTGQTAGPNSQNYTRDQIQFSSVSSDDSYVTKNYGVASNFACGHRVLLPSWIDRSFDRSSAHGTFSFTSKKIPQGPGFFLAIFVDRDSGYALLEALDTWLNPKADFKTFIADVWNRNAGLRLQGEAARYTTSTGDRIDFRIWSNGPSFGAEILSNEYAVNTKGGFLSGSVLNSAGDGLIEISNPGLPGTIILDMRDFRYPKRISENGEIEQAGMKNEVWVDFDAPDVHAPAQEEGDFFRPFKTVAAAVAAVADAGVIKIMPGSTRERPLLSGGKRIRIEAALGGVTIGA